MEVQRKNSDVKEKGGEKYEIVFEVQNTSSTIFENHKASARTRVPVQKI